MKTRNLLVLGLLTCISFSFPVKAEKTYDYSDELDEANLILHCEESNDWSFQGVIGCNFYIQKESVWGEMLYGGLDDDAEEISLGESLKVVLNPGRYFIRATANTKPHTWNAGGHGASSSITIDIPTGMVVHQKYRVPERSSGLPWQKLGKHLNPTFEPLEEKLAEAEVEDSLLNPEDLTLQELTQQSIERKEAQAEIYEVDKGAKANLTRERTITHILEIYKQNSLHAEFSGNSGMLPSLIAYVEGEVRGEIERNLNQTFKDTTIYSATISLDGNVHKKWRIYWYDKVYKGVAKFQDQDGKVYEFPYSFKGVSEFKVEQFKD